MAEQTHATPGTHPGPAPSVPRRRIGGWLALLAVVVLVVAGVIVFALTRGGEGDGTEDDPGATPESAALAYYRALQAQDWDRVCALTTPETADTVKTTQDADTCQAGFADLMSRPPVEIASLEVVDVSEGQWSTRVRFAVTSSDGVGDGEKVIGTQRVDGRWLASPFS